MLFVASLKFFFSFFVSNGLWILSVGVRLNQRDLGGFNAVCGAMFSHTVRAQSVITGLFYE